MTGRIVFAGAGCGAYDLITLRAAEALKSCDAVIYDSLMDVRILEMCPNAEKLCVGKRAGHHSMAQEEINALLIEKALEGKNVVRLKGGDPFVFGRGGEEITAVRELGIQYSVIPGVSSCIAVPELAGIPVTYRKTARSFHVITGHTADDMINYGKYSALDGTLVFLMGLGSLGRIAEGLISGGISADTPAAVISEGGYFDGRQRTVRAPLREIEELASRRGISAPAVIVVGETAAFDLSATYRLPLEGLSVAVVSSRGTAEKLCNGLNALGAFSYRAGGIDIRERFGDEIDRAISELTDYSCIVFTSPNGAGVFLKKLREKRVDLRVLGGAKLAVIGSGTAEVLENAGVFPEIIPEEFTSAKLGELLAKRLGSGERLLIARSREGSGELTKPLLEKGVRFDDVKIYEPVYLRAEKVNARYAVFTSAGAVRGFFENGGELSEKTRCAAIGTITAKELKKFGAFDVLIPEKYNADGIVKAILEDVL